MHFEGDMRNSAHKFRDRRSRFELHPLDPVIARFTAASNLFLGCGASATLPSRGSRKGNNRMTIPGLSQLAMAIGSRGPCPSLQSLRRFKAQDFE